MATFVLVHGKSCGGWCWVRAADQLRAAGHRVFTPTLTGLGERNHLMTPEVDLETHITDIANVLKWERLSDVILVGHSYGGMVVTGAADRERERIALLVYLDAFLPDDGQSVMDLQPPERIEFYRNQAKEIGDGWRLPVTPAEFYNLTDPDDVAWMAEMGTEHPLATLEQPVTLTHPDGPPEKRAYIWASGFTPSPFEKFAAQVRDDPAWIYDEIISGHMVMISHPDELCESLSRLI